jgi:energy-coupling factor transporter ATP-binding protein EcfA2
LGRLNAERGTTIIMVTHDAAVCNSTDRILWLSDGRILKKERKGFNLIRKKLMCPRCHGDTAPDLAECPSCKARLEPDKGPIQAG